MTQTILAKMVVGADGANSVVKRKFGINKIDKEHYCAGVRQYFEGVANLENHENIELHFYRELLPGYLWIFSFAQWPGQCWYRYAIQRNQQAED